MTTTTVPTTVNHQPVIAAILNEPREPGLTDGYVIVRAVTPLSITHTTWHVWLREGDEQWSAENGRYEMTYTDALVDLAHRMGMTVVGE